MKRVLYLSNIQVPYRVQFFNQWAKDCDLTVYYKSKHCAQRNKVWSEREKPCYRMVYRKDLWSLRTEMGHFDAVIVGCYTDPVQIFLMLWMTLMGQPYWINFDGEPFLDGRSWKTRVKRLLLLGAAGFLTAGEKGKQSLENLAGGKRVYSYPFSSLTRQELLLHRSASEQTVRNDKILVIGQYFPYKGLDVALKAAAEDPSLSWIFVGMGQRTERFFKENKLPKNVQLIPFLQKEALETLYQNCALLVLPSRQECWGLVVNEAASFGMPIVSTWGSGAAVEFLGEGYPGYLAKPGDAASLLKCVHTLLHDQDLPRYQAYLLERSQDYNIENMTVQHTAFLEEISHGLHHSAHF